MQQDMRHILKRPELMYRSMIHAYILSSHSKIHVQRRVGGTLVEDGVCACDTD